MASYTRVWEEIHPIGKEDVSLGDDRIRNLKFDLGERLEDLLYGFNVSDGTGDEATPGVKVLNFKEQASIATPSANQINIAAKVGADGDAKAQLWAKDEDGNERQITQTSGSALRLNIKAGDYPADSIDEDDIRLGKNSYLKGLNNAGDGEVDLIKADANDKACLSDGAVLAAATEAGDGDRTISDKKYVDDLIAAAIAANVTLSAYTNKDSDNATMLKTHAYKAATDGYVSAFVTASGAGQSTSFHVGLTDDPYTAGDKVDSHSQDGASAIMNVSGLVAKDEYFEIRTTSTNAVTIRWKSFGTLSKPVDQEP